MNVPTSVNKVYSSPITSVFLLLFILLLVWLDSVGKLKDIITSFSIVNAPGQTEINQLTGVSNKPASVGSSNSSSVIRQALKSAGFTQQGVDTMTAIGYAESGLRSNATANTSKEYSVGPFQINLKAHPYIPESEARDPTTAAKWAYQLSGGGKNYTPWTTYTSGKYRRYIGQ
jgi:hypothetical protein